MAFTVQGKYIEIHCHAQVMPRVKPNQRTSNIPKHVETCMVMLMNKMISEEKGLHIQTAEKPMRFVKGTAKSETNFP